MISGRFLLINFDKEQKNGKVKKGISTSRSQSGSKDRFTPKRKRQYKHILKSELEEGRPVETAKRIAAATVNKTRRKKGEAKPKIK